MLLSGHVKPTSSFINSLNSTTFFNINIHRLIRCWSGGAVATQQAKRLSAPQAFWLRSVLEVEQLLSEEFSCEEEKGNKFKGELFGVACGTFSLLGPAGTTTHAHCQRYPRKGSALAIGLGH